MMKIEIKSFHSDPCFFSLVKLGMILPKKKMKKYFVLLFLHKSKMKFISNQSIKRSELLKQKTTRNHPEPATTIQSETICNHPNPPKTTKNQSGTNRNRLHLIRNHIYPFEKTQLLSQLL